MNHQGTAKPNQAAKIMAASRKTKILFSDQQKENIWKYKLVLSWTIIVKYKENSTTKEVLETALGKILKYLRETAGGDERDAAILPRPSPSKTTGPILSDEDFPEHIVPLEDNYAEMDPKVYCLFGVKKSPSN